VIPCVPPHSPVKEVTQLDPDSYRRMPPPAMTSGLRGCCWRTSPRTAGPTRPPPGPQGVLLAGEPTNLTAGLQQVRRSASATWESCTSVNRETLTLWNGSSTYRRMPNLRSAAWELGGDLYFLKAQLAVGSASRQASAGARVGSGAVVVIVAVCAV
jgi:hypothetical protein